MIQNISAEDFDFSQLDYYDVSSKLNTAAQEDVPLMYIADKDELISEPLWKKLCIDKVSLQKNRSKIIAQIRQLREEKNMVKMIKFKEEIIDCSYSPDKWRTMDNVANKLVLKEDTNSDGKPIYLKYNKYRHLDISNLREIVAFKVNMQKIPKWLKECSGLIKLDFWLNGITKVSSEELPSSLRELTLMSNKLEETALS